MKLWDRYIKLNMWSKIAFWGSVASILGFFTFLAVEVCRSFPPQTPRRTNEYIKLGYYSNMLFCLGAMGAEEELDDTIVRVDGLSALLSLNVDINKTMILNTRKAKGVAAISLATREIVAKLKSQLNAKGKAFLELYQYGEWLGLVLCFALQTKDIEFDTLEPALENLKSKYEAYFNHIRRDGISASLINQFRDIYIIISEAYSKKSFLPEDFYKLAKEATTLLEMLDA